MCTRLRMPLSHHAPSTQVLELSQAKFHAQHRPRMNRCLLRAPRGKLVPRACRMLEVFAEPKECLEDVAMAQWEEASVITVRGTVKSQGRPPFQRCPRATPCMGCAASFLTHFSGSIIYLHLCRSATCPGGWQARAARGPQAGNSCPRALPAGVHEAGRAVPRRRGAQHACAAAGQRRLPAAGWYYILKTQTPRASPDSAWAFFISLWC